MADEIQAQEVNIDVGEIRGGNMTTQIRAHDQGTAGSKSMPSTQAKDEAQNDPKNNIMYKTTVALLEMKGARLQVFLFLVALLFINILLVCAGNTFAKKSLEDEDPGKIAIKYWIAFFLWISGIIVINYIIFVYLPRFDILVLTRRRLLYYMHGLKTNVSACIYFSVALIAWFVHLRPRIKGTGEKTEDEQEAQKTADFVLHVIISLLGGSILWLIKSTFLLVLAASFCCDRFFDRAKESLAQEYVITALDLGPLPKSEAEAKAKRRVLDVVKDCLTCGVVSVLSRKLKEHKVEIDIIKVMEAPAEKFPLYTKRLLVEAISDSVNWTFQQKHVPFMNNEQEAQKAASAIFAKLAHKKDAHGSRYDC